MRILGGATDNLDGGPSQLVFVEAMQIATWRNIALHVLANSTVRDDVSLSVSKSAATAQLMQSVVT